jgi:hypothetical protein
MVAGTVSGAGYFMGDNLHLPRAANPKGFFEGDTIKEINEDLLEGVVLRRPRSPLSVFFRGRPEAGSRWLARVPLGARVAIPGGIAARICAEVARAPFAYKDPRFCYTLPGWRPFLPPDTLFVCVFREPARTVYSILKECAEAPYLRELRMSFSSGLRLWTLMYRHVLEAHEHGGSWLFLHYDQVLEGTGLERLEEGLGTAVDRGFAEPRLKRSPDQGVVDGPALEVYARLCQLAGYER